MTKRPTYNKDRKDKKMGNPAIKKEQLQELFDYKAGDLYWKIKPSRSVKLGSLAGTVHKSGYRRIIIKGKPYMAHRLIFLYHNGHLPRYLDHINRDKLDNRIENLREVTKSQNGANRSIQEGSSKYKGISWIPSEKRWRARIRYNKRLIYIGQFKCEHKAAEAYNYKALELFGEYAHINNIIKSY